MNIFTDRCHNKFGINYRPITLLNTNFGEPIGNYYLGFDQTWAELRCKGKVNPEQPALGAQDHRNNKIQY